MTANASWAPESTWKITEYGFEKVHRCRYCRWNQVFFACTAGMPGRFKGSFDYRFVRTMGCVAYDGAAIGGCYETGSRIAQENAESDSGS
jgi:hypothetical protein